MPYLGPADDDDDTRKPLGFTINNPTTTINQHDHIEIVFLIVGGTCDDTRR